MTQEKRCNNCLEVHDSYGNICNSCYNKGLFHIPDDAKEIKCPECKEWSKYSEWTEGSVGCEDCGDHTALVCPNCVEAIDHVWSEGKFESS